MAIEFMEFAAGAGGGAVTVIATLAALKSKVQGFGALQKESRERLNKVFGLITKLGERVTRTESDCKHNAELISKIEAFEKLHQKMDNIGDQLSTLLLKVGK